MVIVPRLVALGPERLHLVDGEAEDEDIVGAHFFADLDVGTVECADGQRAVRHELHVAGAGRLFAGGGNLLRKIGGRDDFFRERNPIIREEDHFEFPPDAFVGVDPGANDIDRTDDVLREVVARRGLRSEDEDARHQIDCRILQDPPVECENVQQIEMLPLVFVEPFDLHVEQRIRGNHDATQILNRRGELNLVGAFDSHELTLNPRVVGELFQPTEQIEIADPGLAAELPRNQFRQSGVALKQPASRRDAIGFVLKFTRIERVELREEILLQERGVECSDAVDGVRTDHGEIRHADPLVTVLLDEGADALLFVVARPLGFDGDHQVRVDVENELEMARQHAFEESDAPLLQSLGQQGVIGVGEGFRDNRPSGIPRHLLLVDEQAHELDDSDGGVRVVELDGDFVGEICPRVARRPEMPPDEITQGTGDKKILLHEAQLFAVFGLVVRVENF